MGRQSLFVPLVSLVIDDETYIFYLIGKLPKGNPFNTKIMIK